MARIRMVTRTVIETLVTCMTVSVSDKTLSNNTLKVSGEFSDNDSLLKAVKAVHETDDFKVVAVVKSTVLETLYGMTEDDFIAHANILPPRKTYDNETDNT